MGWYVLTKLTRPITGLLERDLRRMEEKGKVWEVDKRWIGLCMYKGWRWGKLMWSRGEVGRRGEGGSTHVIFIINSCHISQLLHNNKTLVPKHWG